MACEQCICRTTQPSGSPRIPPPFVWARRPLLNQRLHLLAPAFICLGVRMTLPLAAQSPGRIDWETLKASGVGLEQLIRHFIFTQVWRPHQARTARMRCAIG